MLFSQLRQGSWLLDELLQSNSKCFEPAQVLIHSAVSCSNLGVTNITSEELNATTRLAQGLPVLLAPQHKRRL